MGPSLQLSTCVLFWGFLGLFVPAVEGTKPRSSSVSSQANAILSCNNVTLLALLDIFRCKVKRLVDWTTGGDVMGIFAKNAISRRDLDL